MCFFKQNEKGYCICIAKQAIYAEQRFATLLQDLLKKRFSIEASISDNLQSDDYAIRIGAACADVPAVVHGYAITVGESFLELNAGSLHAYEYLYKALNTHLLDEICAMAQGSRVQVDLSSTLKAENNASILERKGEFRALFHNACGWTVGNWWCKPELRNPMIEELYLEYSPDIICIQEYTPSMSREDRQPLIPRLEKRGYANVEVEQVGDWKTTTPILYKKDDWNALDSGLIHFASILPLVDNKQKDKFATWVVLENVKTEKRLVVFSVHLDSASDENRNMQAPYVVKLAKDLQEKYQCPALVGGDMNCDKFSQAYASYLNDGLIDVFDVLEQKKSVRSYFDKYPTYREELNLFVGEGTSPADHMKSVDHVFYLGDGLIPRVQDILNDSCASAVSDHCGTLLDFDLK